MFSGDEHERRKKNSGNQSLIRGLRLINLLSHYPNGCPLAKLAELQAEIEEYLVYYNQKRIKLGLKGLSPVRYRAQYLS